MGLNKIEVEMALGKLVQGGFVEKEHFNNRDFFKYSK